jgi:anti-sigma-K factor RskA
VTPPPGDGTERACGHDAGAYVLGALEPDEVQRFREHLEHCTACREEIASLGSVVEALPMAAPQLAVNRALRRRGLADVRAARRRGERERRRARASQSARPLRGSRLAIAAAAMAVLVAAVAAAVELPSGGSSKARVVRASVTPGYASALVQVKDGHAVLVVRRMPAPPLGDIYEVWLKRSSGAPIATSALFSVTKSGAADVDVPGNLSDVQAVLVTPEHSGGSLRPTHAPVIVAKVA